MPEKILDAVLISGDLNYMVKWKDIDMVITLEAKFVAQKWPQILIKYLESITIILK